MTVRSSMISAIAAASLIASAGSASAACKSMGFTVNDYGKEGPTKDAKDLLDKEIAKWAAESRIEKYTVGKKTVTCELFLDVILFDEHTCTARASVCWGEGATAPPKTAKSEEKSAPKKGTSKTEPAAHDSVEATAEESAKPTDTANAYTEEPKDGPPVAVETGAIDQTAPASAAGDNDAAERAAAAAERAAAAAERAAAAAEKAAAGRGTDTAAGEGPTGAAR